MPPNPAPLSTVLVATDFSECANVALAWGRLLGKQRGARLVLQHALAPPQGAPGFPEFAAYPAELHVQYRKAVSDRLDEEVQRLRAEGIDAVSDLRVGPASPTILAAAEEHEADLIISGTRGLRGLRHLVLGSTAKRLVQHSAVPVLTVQTDMLPPEQLKRVLVPTDFSEDAALALQTALDLFGAGEETEFVLFHAFHIPPEYIHLAGGFVLSDMTRGALEQARAELEKAAKPLGEKGYRITTACMEGDAAEGIESEARRRDVDLIAMGTHGRSFLPHLLLGSTAERAVGRAPCPVLTVRRNRDEGEN